MDSADVNRIERMLIDFKDEIKGELQHQLAVQREDFQKQLAFVGEGFQMLSEKLDRMEERLDCRIDCVVRKLDAVAAQGSITATRLEVVSAKLDAVAAQGNTTAAKLDAVAADLKAHRRDTEAHQSLYKVKED